MAATTYGYISEQILTTYYKGIRSDDSSYSLRHIASMVAQEVAFMARKNAFENSNAGDVTYMNDMFITTYQSVPVLYDSVAMQKYCVLPATPAALPNNQEIVSVSLNTKTNKTFIPMRNKDRFAQAFLCPIKGMVFYYIESGKLYFDNPENFQFTALTIKMAGAISDGDNILDAYLNVPKNYETEIIDKVLARLLSVARLGQDLTNDGDSLPNNV
jgi:hypothetical protein